MVSRTPLPSLSTLVLPSALPSSPTGSGSRKVCTWPLDKPTETTGSSGCNAVAKTSESRGKVQRFSNIVTVCVGCARKLRVIMRRLERSIGSWRGYFDVIYRKPVLRANFIAKCRVFLVNGSCGIHTQVWLTGCFFLPPSSYAVGGTFSADRSGQWKCGANSALCSGMQRQ